jgi:hypothetical protein
MTEDNEDKGFVIKDRRIFSSEEDKHEEAAPKEEDSKPKPEQVEAIGAEKEEHIKEDKGEEDYALLEMNFSNFILSMHASALFHFGDLSDPVSGKTAKNIPAAKQTIDMLDMLRKKTEGNLDGNEESLIEGVLYELRMRYIKESGKS